MNKKELKAKIYYADSFCPEIDLNGIACEEMLPGSHEEVRAYRYHMKAGSCLKPDSDPEHTLLYIFSGEGEAVVKDEESIHRVKGLCFYIPAYKNCAYQIQAMTDIDFIMVRSHMDSYDWEVMADTGLKLPWFRTEAQCPRYEQDDCKSPGMQSRTVIGGQFDCVGRLTAGICQGFDSCGTDEDGHPSVHQWNYSLPGSDYSLFVGKKENDSMMRYNRKSGDWDFIPGGLDHQLYAAGGKMVYYVWVELNTHKYGE